MIILTMTVAFGSYLQSLVNLDCQKICIVKLPLIEERFDQHMMMSSVNPERQSARMSKITNDGLTRPGTGCFIAVPMWHHWASKG